MKWKPFSDWGVQKHIVVWWGHGDKSDGECASFLFSWLPHFQDNDAVWKVISYLTVSMRLFKQRGDVIIMQHGREGTLSLQVFKECVNKGIFFFRIHRHHQKSSNLHRRLEKCTVIQNSAVHTFFHEGRGGRGGIRFWSEVWNVNQAWDTTMTGFYMRRKVKIEFGVSFHKWSVM